METNQAIRWKFNQQAEKFSKWSVTKNTEYMTRYFEFCEIKPDERLLDVASGSGEFALFCAPKVASVTGMDISDGMIALARKQAGDLNIGNTRFECADVESLPLPDKAFTMVISKSALHHYRDRERVFREMIRCCEPGGRISLQDIVAYDDQRVNEYFEALEKEIDASHHKTASSGEMVEMYNKYGMDIQKTFELEIELNFYDYINHAVQSESGRERIKELLSNGLHDQEISGQFLQKEDELYFRRKVFLILGARPI